MKKLMAMVVLMSVTLASAAPFKLTPARVGVTDIRKSNDVEYARYWNYKAVEAEWPYIDIIPTRQVPTNAWFMSQCEAAIGKKLKAPASAEYNSKPTTYVLRGGVYANSGEVDSQNSYGAMLRAPYYCMSVYEGTARGGTVYMYSWLSERER